MTCLADCRNWQTFCRGKQLSPDIGKAYELLGVKPGVSPRELKAAHRDLAKVWHPDRFGHDPRLQQKALEKLKEINEAYELLISGKTPKPSPAPRPQRVPRTRTTAPKSPQRIRTGVAGIRHCCCSASRSRFCFTTGLRPHRSQNKASSQSRFTRKTRRRTGIGNHPVYPTSPRRK